MNEIEKTKLGYYKCLDSRSWHIARLLSLRRSRAITPLLLKYISELYKAERHTFEDDHFKSAYHTPITSDLEFLVARIFYHYSKFKKLGWNVYLRKQSKENVGGRKALVVPDIRIEKSGVTIGIVELKAGVGFNQNLYSGTRTDHDREKFKKHESAFDPDRGNEGSRNQFKKYQKAFHITKNEFFVLVPSLSAAYRKKYGQDISAYEKHFLKTSGLNKESFVLLSNNPGLRLDGNKSLKNFQPVTRRFEDCIFRMEDTSRPSGK